MLASDPSIEVYGPGHNSFTVDEDGNDILVYHARKESVIEGDPLYNPNRHTVSIPIQYGAPVSLAEYVRNIFPSRLMTAGPSFTQKPTLSQS